MLKNFRIVAYLEAISFLVLLFIAMPMKYWYGMPLAVRIVGAVHGILFVIYVGMLGPLAAEQRWARRVIVLGFVASILPFGAILFDRYLLKLKRSQIG